MKNVKHFLISLAASAVIGAILASSAFAAGGPGGGMSSSPSYTGVNEISTSVNESGKTYKSSSGSQNAILVTGGTSTISKATVTKTGDESDENSDFYGTNAAVIATDGTLSIKDSKISTNGAHANAVFAYGDGTVNISDSVINTSANNSGGIMVTGGGTLNADNLTVTTQGNSSAAIRSDRGGGDMNINSGTYTSNGTGSPVIYSTANVNVKNATLNSTKSEGIVVEGKNSVTLVNTKLTDSNTTLNGQSETYKNIFLYQSMSGDADSGKAKFSATDSTITTKNGDVFYVTNTTAQIELTNTQFITESDGDFLRIEAAAWGNSGSNGGTVTLNASAQEIEGDITADEISALSLTLTDKSSYSGTINADNTAKSLSLTVSEDSIITLTGDSYVTALNDDAENYSNINLNGYTLYVNGTAITSTGYNGGETKTKTVTTTTKAADSAQTNEESSSPVKYIVIACAAIVLAGAAVGAVVVNKKRAAKKKAMSVSPSQREDK